MFYVTFCLKLDFICFRKYYETKIFFQLYSFKNYIFYILMKLICNVKIRINLMYLFDYSMILTICIFLLPKAALNIFLKHLNSL